MFLFSVFETKIYLLKQTYQKFYTYLKLEVLTKTTEDLCLKFYTEVII